MLETFGSESTLKCGRFCTSQKQRLITPHVPSDKAASTLATRFISHLSPFLALGYRRHSLWLAENEWLPRGQHTKVAKLVRHLPTKGCEGIGDGLQRALKSEGPIGVLGQT